MPILTCRDPIFGYVPRQWSNRDGPFAAREVSCRGILAAMDTARAVCRGGCDDAGEKKLGPGHPADGPGPVQVPPVISARLTHARSYSTLLCHILGSHPQICGYSEAMIPYETAVDLIRLNCEVFRAGNYRRDCDYVLTRSSTTPSGLPTPSSASTGHPLFRGPQARLGDRQSGPHADPRARAGDQRLEGSGAIDPRRNVEMAAVYYVARLGSSR